MPSITLGFALTLSSLALGPSTTTAPSVPARAPQAQTVKETVAAYFADVPIMVAISSCESHFRQYDVSGSVYRGEQNHQDVGVMQINEHYHLDVSKKLGYDIYTTEGNMAYARFLYEQEGVAPWMSSSPCWQRSVAAHNLENAKVLASAVK
ncbi:MAG: hypothetical protein WCI89_01850 [bacterium]